MTIIDKDGNIDSDVKRVCHNAVARAFGYANVSVLHGYGYSYEDAMQDAYLIAISQRGKKEAKNVRELYFKVYYGMLDYLRAMTKYRKERRRDSKITFMSLEEFRLSKYGDKNDGEYTLKELGVEDDVEARDGKEWYVRMEDNEGKLHLCEEDVRRVVAECATLRDQKLVWAHYYLGKSMRECGQMVGLSEGGVSYALKALRERMKERLARIVDDDNV